jgi:RNA polymerase sigma-70 factor (ECF subfamily)
VLPWLYRVVRNQGLADRRSAARRRQREQKGSSPVAWFDAVDDQLDAREATRLLAELELEQREVIVARLWGGLTFAEIAPLIGCSLATAQRRYQAGLMELKKWLETQWTPRISPPTT